MHHQPAVLQIHDRKVASYFSFYLTPKKKPYVIFRSSTTSECSPFEEQVIFFFHCSCHLVWTLCSSSRVGWFRQMLGTCRLLLQRGGQGLCGLRHPMGPGGLKAFILQLIQVDVSKNNGTPKSSIFDMVFHYKPSILGTPIFGNTQVETILPKQITSTQKQNDSLAVFSSEFTPENLPGPSKGKVVRPSSNHDFSWAICGETSRVYCILFELAMVRSSSKKQFFRPPKIDSNKNKTRLHPFGKSTFSLSFKSVTEKRAITRYKKNPFRQECHF